MTCDEARALLAWAEEAMRGQRQGNHNMRAIRADQIHDLCRAWLIVHGEGETRELVRMIRLRRGER